LLSWLSIRLFALHRFKEVVLLQTPCKRPVNFSLKEYASSGALEFNDYGVIQFKAKFTFAAGQHLYETPLSKDQTITKDETGNLIISATINNNSQLHWWLRGFGDEVEVISPIKLL
jgi:predicted DNA-binding transcriptional regulator YafY